MRYEDAKAMLSRLARQSARAALFAGDNPLVLLNGHTGGAREIMKEAIAEEMLAAVQRVSDEWAAAAAFYRAEFAEMRGKLAETAVRP